MFIKDALYHARDILQSYCISSSFLDALVLLSHVTGLSKEKILISQDKLNVYMQKKFFDLIKLRVNKNPVQYLINCAEFMGLNFFVDHNVLIPRSDTEILCEHAIKFIDIQKNIKVLDLCTGSGCIAIALKKFCAHAKITALDISQSAIDIAQDNALKNQTPINFICADVFEILTPKFAQEFNLIISNPPYIKSDELKNLDESIKNFEPMISLDGGDDGLVFYKFISRQIKHDCNIFFEIGFDQANDVKNILLDNNITDIKILKDLSNLDRVIIAQKSI